MKPRGVLSPFPFWCVMEKVKSMKLKKYILIKLNLIKHEFEHY